MRGSRSWVALAFVVMSSCGGSVMDQTASTPAAPNDRAAVLATVALARVARDNSFGGEDVFTEVAIVERLGRGSDDGMVAIDAASPAWTPDERAAVEQALAPRSVTWVASLEAVIGPGPSMTSPERLIAVVTISSPEIDGDNATVTSMLWCGGTCGAGSTHTLSRDPQGIWTITGTTGGAFIS
jgi:hypothetical protein